MKKRDRVFAAIRGEEVDHVPCGFSLHFPHDRAFGDASVEAHLRFFKETDTDIIKIIMKILFRTLARSERQKTGKRFLPIQ